MLHYPGSDKVVATVLASLLNRKRFTTIYRLSVTPTRPLAFSIANLALDDGLALVDNFDAYFTMDSKILKN